jgi:Mg2+ and Co2+ transporter CorA
MELSFDSGVKEYTIRGVNGIVTVHFNPADVNFAKKAYRVFNDLRKKQEERVAKLDTTEPGDELFDMVDSIDREMRDIINDLFEQDIADMLFGSVNAYSAANGAPVWQNFMNAIIDQFDEATKREQALADEKIRKYTQKYKK